MAFWYLLWTRSCPAIIHVCSLNFLISTVLVVRVGPVLHMMFAPPLVTPPSPSGYFVEVLGSPATCFDPQQYGALLVVDPGEGVWVSRGPGVDYRREGCGV